MKVKELIEQLNKMNPDATVYIESETIDHFEIDSVFDYGFNSVYLGAILTGW